jgi:hypothetical protein
LLKDYRRPQMAFSGVLRGLWLAGRQGGCPFGMVALASPEFQRQVDALDLAEPSFCFGSAAAGVQVCLDLV